MQAKLRNEYARGHNFHLNSVHASADGEHFLTADEVRINIWNVEHPLEAYLVVDRTPTKIEAINEVITCAEFHPY